MSDPNGGPITLREVYGLIEGVKTSLLAEMRTMEATVDARLTKHEVVHDAHSVLHDRERDRRSSLFRWGITSVIALLAIMASAAVAIYIAALPGGLP
jgi:hypothetical protein